MKRTLATLLAASIIALAAIIGFLLAMTRLSPPESVFPTLAPVPAPERTTPGGQGTGEGQARPEPPISPISPLPGPGQEGPQGQIAVMVGDVSITRADRHTATQLDMVMSRLAPGFTLDSAQGARVTLSDYQDKLNVVVVFYRGQT